MMSYETPHLCNFTGNVHTMEANGQHSFGKICRKITTHLFCLCRFVEKPPHTYYSSVIRFPHRGMNGPFLGCLFVRMSSCVRLVYSSWGKDKSVGQCKKLEATCSTWLICHELFSFFWTKRCCCFSGAVSNKDNLGRLKFYLLFNLSIGQWEKTPVRCF